MRARYRGSRAEFARTAPQIAIDRARREFGLDWVRRSAAAPNRSRGILQAARAAPRRMELRRFEQDLPAGNGNGRAFHARPGSQRLGRQAGQVIMGVLVREYRVHRTVASIPRANLPKEGAHGARRALVVVGTSGYPITNRSQDRHPLM